MVYNAYIKWTGSRDTYRYVLTAPNVETIDEWWRAVSSTTGYGFQRLSTDFYTYKDSNWYNAKPEFDTRLLWTLLNDSGGRTQPLFTNISRSDPVSGNTFYIRSKSKPEVYWYVTAENQGRIYASSLGRTRFRVRIDGEKDGAGTIMIGSDKILITKASDPKLAVGLNSGELYLSEHTNYFAYSDLKNKFLAQGETQPGGEVRNTAIVKAFDVGLGEEWELVS